jgi:hypothetical protein
VIASASFSMLAGPAAGAPGDSLLAGVTGVLDTATGAAAQVDDAVTATVESLVAPVEAAVPGGGIIEPAAVVETVVEPVTSTVGAAGQAAAGATGAVLGGAVEAVGSLLPEPPTGGEQPGAIPEAPPVAPPPVASPTPSEPPAEPPPAGSERPPAGTETGPRPVDGTGSAGGSSTEPSATTAAPPASPGAAFPVGSTTGDAAIGASAGAPHDPQVVPAPSLPDVTGAPTFPLRIDVRMPDAPAFDGSPAATVFPPPVRATPNDEPETFAALWSPEWAAPLLAVVDPRAPLGAVIFILLGLGALSFAIAGIPRRAYAAAGLSCETDLALRVTLGCAGLVLVAAAGIGQFTV